MNWQAAARKNTLVLLSILFLPISYLVKTGRVVILQTHSRNLYCDNTKYLYESLLEMKNIEVYWVADNSDLKQYIKDKNLNYITWSNPIKTILIPHTYIGGEGAGRELLEEVLGFVFSKFYTRSSRWQCL